MYPDAPVNNNVRVVMTLGLGQLKDFMCRYAVHGLAMETFYMARFEN